MNEITSMEFDPIEPFIRADSKVLILGSFPAKKARESGFYYAHPSNRFWSVLAEVVGVETPKNINEKKQLLENNHIALWNVVHACTIDGSKDSSIKNVIPNDLNSKLKDSNITKIFTSGKKAGELYRRYCFDKVQIPDIYLPSTSAVNRPNFSHEKLVEEYSQIKKYL